MPGSLSAHAARLRTAPPEVIRIEEATDPKRRVRLQARSRRPIASPRLRLHLAQLAELQMYRQPSESPTVDDPQTVPVFEPLRPLPTTANDSRDQLC